MRSTDTTMGTCPASKRLHSHHAFPSSRSMHSSTAIHLPSSRSMYFSIAVTHEILGHNQGHTPCIYTLESKVPKPGTVLNLAARYKSTQSAQPGTLFVPTVSQKAPKDTNWAHIGSQELAPKGTQLAPKWLPYGPRVALQFSRCSFRALRFSLQIL